MALRCESVAGVLLKSKGLVETASARPTRRNGVLRGATVRCHLASLKDWCSLRACGTAQQADRHKYRARRESIRRVKAPGDTRRSSGYTDESQSMWFNQPSEGGYGYENLCGQLIL